MKKIILALCPLLLCFSNCGHAQNNNIKKGNETMANEKIDLKGKKVLVAYFSWTGNTKAVAEEIARLTGADTYRIDAREPYEGSYEEVAYGRAKKEWEDGIEPAVADTLLTLNDYDVIFVGSPVWWHQAAMVVHSFLHIKDYHFDGKVVIPFCTYADTYGKETNADIINLTPHSIHAEGYLSQNADVKGVSAWLQRIIKM